MGTRRAGAKKDAVGGVTATAEVDADDAKTRRIRHAMVMMMIVVVVKVIMFVFFTNDSHFVRIDLLAMK